jgi:hypothetical protein
MPNNQPKFREKPLLSPDNRVHGKRRPIHLRFLLNQPPITIFDGKGREKMTKPFLTIRDIAWKISFS